MLERMETMFDGMSDMMKRLKKASYEKNMRSFRAQNEHYFLEMTDLVRDAADAEKEQAAAPDPVPHTGGSEFLHDLLCVSGDPSDRSPGGENGGGCGPRRVAGAFSGQRRP